MPSPNSLASLSRLSSLPQQGGSYPSYPFNGEDPAEYEMARMGDEVEAQTGLNPTAMHNRALADLADHLDNLDFQKRNRQNTLRHQDSEFLGPEGWARSSPEDAQHARDLQFGDERVAHEAANLPTLLRMGHEAALAHGKDVSDVYWQPGTSSMRESEQQRAESMGKIRYLDPAEYKSNADIQKAMIDAGAKTGAATITASGHSADQSNRGYIDVLRSLLQRADVTPTDADALNKMISGITGPIGARPGTGTPAGGGGDDPHVGMAQQQGPGDHTFSDGQIWRVTPGQSPTRLK